MPTFRATDQVMSRPVDDEVVLLDLESGACYSLNSSGRAVWDGVARGASRDDLVANLMASFDVDAPTAEADVDTLLALLVARGLVVEDPS